MKGIILAGGSGTRLHPVTQAVSKQLLPVYDKPMIYYPLSTLMSSGIRDILVISTPKDIDRFANLLEYGQQWGIRLHYMIQPTPVGIAQAFIIGTSFLAGDKCCLILGDNVFHGYDFTDDVRNHESGATVFAYQVKNPEWYGVVEFDKEGQTISLEEKPSHPKSRYAVTGIYLYDSKAVEAVRTLNPSARGELEITDLNNWYLQRGELQTKVLGRGVAWLDTGTHDSLLEASNFIHTIEKRQGLKVACPEEIAYRLGYIDAEQLEALAKNIGKSSYGDYLYRILEEPTNGRGK